MVNKVGGKLKRLGGMMMIAKSAISSLALPLVLFMPAAAQTSDVAAPADQQQVADFLDYNTRLLKLIAIYRGNTNHA